MKNHWMNQRKVKSYIVKISNRVCELTGIDIKKFRALVEAGIKENPLSDDEISKICSATDEEVDADINGKALRFAKMVNGDDDGLW
jgi:hypothetical protein